MYEQTQPGQIQQNPSQKNQSYYPPQQEAALSQQNNQLQYQLDNSQQNYQLQQQYPQIDAQYVNSDAYQGQPTQNVPQFQQYLYIPQGQPIPKPKIQVVPMDNNQISYSVFNVKLNMPGASSFLAIIYQEVLMVLVFRLRFFVPFANANQKQS